MLDCQVLLRSAIKKFIGLGKFMVENDHCKLSVSIFSRWGKAEHWLFGNFLKYSKNNLVSEKPELVFETFNQETKVQNPIVLSRGPHPSLREKNLKDAAMFCYRKKSDRPILDLQFSSYLRSVIEDDYKAGNNIHIFDLEFRNEYQLENEFSVQAMVPSLTDNLDKIKKPVLTEKIRFKSSFNEALWVAKIISHRSVHLNEYIKAVNSDPVWREGLKSYFDPFIYDHAKKKYGLGKYLDRYREECDVPF